MKKLILSVAVLAGMTFVACSDDSNEAPRVAYTGGCQICEIPETGPSQVEEQPYEVCIDVDGIAYVDNAYTGLQADYYFELYCANEMTAPTNPGGGGGDPTGSTEPGTPTEDCQTCEEYTMGGMTMPAVEVCKGTNGNAFIDDVDMEIYFDQYITLQELITPCN